MFVDNHLISKPKNASVSLHMVRDMAKSLGKDVDAAIAEATCQRTALTSPEYQGQRTELCGNWINIEAEGQMLLTECDFLEDHNIEAFAQMVKQQFNQLGCSLQQSRSSYNDSLYRFDFGNERCITIGLDGTHLRLLEMCPVNANFKNIQEFLEKSQDLLGLLVGFGNMLQQS